jgi:regulatory protein
VDRIWSGRFPLGDGVWHKNGVSPRHHIPRSPPPPLDLLALRELALRYVGQYATSRAKLAAYLLRKIRERGWEGDPAPDVMEIANRFAEQGYVDDAAFALAQSRSLGARGYGKRRLTEKLRLTGIEEPDRAAAIDHADAEAVDAALRFAQRRRIGPFSSAAGDIRQREKWIAAMIRAGHGFPIARALSAMLPGSAIDVDRLREFTDRSQA